MVIYMNFEEFKSNVEHWATERGIYEHSTPDVQLLKMLSEIGELADAFIKGEPLEEKIGSVAICWINYCEMKGFSLEKPHNTTEWDKRYGYTNQAIAKLLVAVTRGLERGDDLGINLIFDYLTDIAYFNRLDFKSCCEAAWNKIKDRKGRMTAGGAFVYDADIAQGGDALTSS